MSRDVYDRWSRHRWALDALYELVFLGRQRRFRRESLAALALERGERVLELGCGPGNSLAALRDAVGPEGVVVGLDFSPGMVARATERVADAGWENVHVVRGDATRPGVPDGVFDAAYAAMSLSAMSDPAAAVRAAAASLDPDGRLAVLDARPFQSLPLSLANPVLDPVLARLTDWNYEADVPGAIEASFGTTTVESYEGGAVYVATATGPVRDDHSQVENC